jgi:hypothetical protein
MIASRSPFWANVYGMNHSAVRTLDSDPKNIIGTGPSHTTTMGKSLAVFHHGCVVVILVLVLLLDHHGSFVISSSSTSTADEVVPAGGIAVLGLGRMGTAVARCLAGGEKQEEEDDQAVLRPAAKGRSVRAVVHAWNRSPPRHLTDNDPSKTILLHSTLEYAVGNATTGMVLVVIDDWTGARQVTSHVARYIAEREELEREGARPTTTTTTTTTVVVFSTYTPDEMQDLFDALSSSSLSSSQSSPSHTMNLVGGAIVGIPETICSTATLVLLSASSSSTGQAVKTLLDPLGTVVSIDADDVEEEDPSPSSSSSPLSNHNNNNVGSASLLNIALILTITFGLAGSELALLMIQSAASTNNSNNRNDRPTSSFSSLLDVYDQLARDVAVSYIRLLLPLVSTAFRDGSFRATYVPAPTLHGLLYKVCRYLHASLGVSSNDTFLDAYVASLGAVRDPDQGPVAWIKPLLPSSSSSLSTTTTISTTTEMSPPSSSEKEEL